MIDFKKMITFSLALLGAWVTCVLINTYLPSWVNWTFAITVFVGCALYVSYKPKDNERRYYILSKHVIKGEPVNGISSQQVIFTRVSCVGTLKLPKEYFDDLGEMSDLTCVEVDKETFDIFGEKAKEIEQSRRKDNGLE